MRPGPRFRLVDVALFSGAICWGSTYLFAKDLLTIPGYAPVLVAARMLLSAAVLALFVIAVRRGRTTAAEWGCGILLGLPLSAVFALETYGVALTSATNAGVLISLCIVIVPFAEAAVRRTRPRPLLVALSVAAFVGAALLATGGRFVAPGLGDLLVLGAALARVVHVTMSGALQSSRSLDPYRVTAVQLGTVGVLFALACPMIHAPVGEFFAALTGPRLAALLYLAVIAGAVVFAVQTWGIARTSAAHASLLLGTEPVWAAMFGVLFAGDRLGPIAVIGMVIALAAVLVAQRVSAASSPNRDGTEPDPLDQPRAAEAARSSSSASSA